MLNNELNAQASVATGTNSSISAKCIFFDIAQNDNYRKNILLSYLRTLK